MVASWPGGATDSASRVARCDAAAHRSAICRHQSAVVLHAAAREASGDLASDSPAMPRPTTVENDAARWRAITRAVEAHERTDARWLEYELDAAKLLDFPVMTDMRDPLTTAFHKAKLQADFHKPLRAEDLLDDPDAAGHYLDAVRDYVTAFDTAEAEAMRRRRTGFSARNSSGWQERKACCGWHPTPARRPRNASAHIVWRAPNSTDSSCCRTVRGPASSGDRRRAR